jgi:hypothetical protein
MKCDSARPTHFRLHMKRVTNNMFAIKDRLGHSTTQQTEDYLKVLDDETIHPEAVKLYGS